MDALGEAVARLLEAEARKFDNDADTYWKGGMDDAHRDAGNLRYLKTALEGAYGETAERGREEAIHAVTELAKFKSGIDRRNEQQERNPDYSLARQLQESVTLAKEQRDKKNA
jgi:hypothetical protein